MTQDLATTPTPTSDIRPPTSAPKRRWRLRGRQPEGDLANAPYPPLIRHLLWHRGVRTPDEAAAFMDSDPVEYDPLLLPDIGAALDRLRRAVNEGELIAVYGDFDVDGVTASTILIEGLRDLGGRVEPYLPDRFSEGYGVNIGAIDKLHAQGVTLIATADCGTSSIAEVAHAAKLGIDMIILDHHTVPPELPAAVALVNPKRAENRYPEAELASGGLAFKVMAALYEALGRPWDPERYIDLVALSTVCDVAPLQNENRTLVRQGVAALERTQRPGLRALLETSGLKDACLDTDSIGYVLGPRLNAAGRLADARLALDLLLETDPERAMQQALALGSLNGQRQQATAAAMELARELLSKEDADAPLIFIGHADIPSGIVGLVAGRLAEEYHRPAVVYQRGEATSRASCRSIPEFDITGALRTCPELMVRFGGHPAAAGFTVENEKLPALKEALLRQATAGLAGVELAPAIDIDAALDLRHMNGKLIRMLSQLAPFGCANPEPVFLSRNIEIASVKSIGEDGEHLRLRLRDGAVTWPAIAFASAGASIGGFSGTSVREGGRFDVVYSFCPDRGGNGGLELRVRDLRPAQAPD
ncbi:MAG: single-stranded-DNA-specific exonuclease RecJ [Chloroflexi bacterium]|nr:MAG: single-stranded-DNA-specific exonuclease RecJ [Chloroflexota bacterium]